MAILLEIIGAMVLLSLVFLGLRAWLRVDRKPKDGDESETIFKCYSAAGPVSMKLFIFSSK